MSEPPFGSDRMWGLKELPWPEPVSWFAWTPGTLLVLGILLALLSFVAWRRFRAWQRNRYRREALAELASMNDALTDLPTVLRHTALTAFPREEVASLRGAAWVEWLNENGARFEASDAAWLDRLPYDPEPGPLPVDLARRLRSTSATWVREHRARV